MSEHRCSKLKQSFTLQSKHCRQDSLSLSAHLDSIHPAHTTGIYLHTTLSNPLLQEVRSICLGWWAKTWELPMVRTWPWKIRKNWERVKEGNMIGETTGLPTIFTSNKFLLGSRSDGLKFKWPQGQNWPPSLIVSYYYQNADQKLREYLFTVQVKPKLVSRVTYSLRKAAEREGWCSTGEINNPRRHCGQKSTSPTKVQNSFPSSQLPFTN